MTRGCTKRTLEEVLAAQQADHARLAQQYTDQVTRAEYEARLAQRQYQAVDPDNRLVAAELERRWELALRAVVEAREAAEHFATQPPAPQLPPLLQEQLRDLGHHLPALWERGQLTPAQQFLLLRRLIRRVIVTRPVPDTVEARVVGVSGAVTALTVHPPILRAADVSNYEEFVADVLRLAAEGYHDAEIAERLTAAGFRVPRSGQITAALVASIRQVRGQISLTDQFKTQAKVDGQWTVYGLAQELSVHRNWLYARIRNGTLPATRHPVTGHYLIPDDPDILDRLRTQRERCCYH